MQIRSLVRAATAAAILGLVAPTAARSQSFAFDNSVPFNAVPGLTSFQTDFGDVLGMGVSWTFAGGGGGSASWASLGSGYCGVGNTTLSSGKGFMLRGTCSDDTFFSPWTMFGANLSSFTVFAAPGLGVFDRIGSPDLSPGSSAGHQFSFDCSGYSSSCNVFGGTDFWNTLVTFSNPVKINGAAPLYDLYSTMKVEFRTTFNTAGGDPTNCAAASSNDNNNNYRHSSSVNTPDKSTSCDWLQFTQDMDNVPPGGSIDNPAAVVPEPASMTLLATGLVGMMAAARKRRKK